MRATILNALILALLAVTAGCGPASIGHFGGAHAYDEQGFPITDDDNAPVRDFDFHKLYADGSLAEFPRSDEGGAVIAGGEYVGFERLDGGSLLVRGTAVPTYQLTATGDVLHLGAVIGHMVYTIDGDRTVRTAMISVNGRALELQIAKDSANLVESDATLTLAPADIAPDQVGGLPIATPVF